MSNGPCCDYHSSNYNGTFCYMYTFFEDDMYMHVHVYVVHVHAVVDFVPITKLVIAKVPLD